jgi:anti-sigma factor RsiW
MSGRELDCNEVVEMVTDYLEGVLDPETTQDFERHLGECPGCVAYVEQMQATIAMVGRIEQPEVPDEVVESLVAIFRNEAGARRGCG